MRLFRWLRTCVDNRRYPELSIFPDGSIVRVRDGKVLGKVERP